MEDTQWMDMRTETMMRKQTIHSITGTFVIMAAVFGVALAVLSEPRQVKSADAQFGVTSKIYPAVGREDELEERLIRMTQLVKKLEPEFTFHLQRSMNEPVFFVLYQIYPSQAAFEKHRVETMQTVRKELGSPPEGIMARLSEIEYFRILVN
jgi:quinol monooxygenase YgiN